MKPSFVWIRFVFVLAVFALCTSCSGNQTEILHPDGTLTSEQPSGPLETDLQQTPIDPLPPVLLPEDADGKFTIAVIPDTQQEVVASHAIRNQYFRGRVQWLYDSRKQLDLRCVLHTGDVVNWGNEDPSQFVTASDAMAPLDGSGIPVLYAIGNHDTAAVKVGGSAADPSNTRARQRDTTRFNEYFPLSRYEGLTPFEEGKIDNVYQTFFAAGANFLVLSVELWPRTEVMEWAASVIEEHPNHNVIVITHSFLTADGQIFQKVEYGHNSPQTLFDKVISEYPNVRLVFSGHTGQANYRIEKGKSGNRIACFVGAFHSNDSNPVQLLEVDTAADTVHIRTYVPLRDETWGAYSALVEDMNFLMAEE